MSLCMLIGGREALLLEGKLQRGEVKEWVAEGGGDVGEQILGFSQKRQMGPPQHPPPPSFLPDRI